MKEFEKVYEELIKKYEGNTGKAFATEIYEAGRNVSFSQNLKDAVKNDGNGNKANVLHGYDNG